MKKILIGLHLRKHDANISIYDGNNFHYFCFERQDKGIKKQGYHNSSRLSSYPDDYNSSILKKYLKKLKIEKNQILALAVGDSCWHFHAENNLYQKVNWHNDICNDVYFVDHHYAHHLSAFENKNSWVLDGKGNDLRYSTVFRNNEIVDTLYEPEDGHSIGYFLDDFAEKILNTFDGAGHAMALDSLGKTFKEYYETFKSAPLNKSNIFFDRNFFEKHFLRYNSSIDRFNYDYIKTVHEIAKVNHLEHIKKFFNTSDKIAFTGGVSQSIILNTHLKKNLPNLEITPHGYDGGISLGLIMFLTKLKNYSLPSLDNFPFIQADEHPGFPKKETIIKTSEYLAQGKIVLWYQGNGEIGPRALGNRSILANPLISDMKEQVNNKVKKRAWFRPYGASVLVEDYKKYFDLEWESPYMLYQANVKDPMKFKSITHFDNTCRIQTVNSKHSVFYELLDMFKKRTGISTLLNTSFNLPGKPIVGSKNDAKATFDSSRADVLVMGNDIYTK